MPLCALGDIADNQHSGGERALDHRPRADIASQQGFHFPKDGAEEHTCRSDEVTPSFMLPIVMIGQNGGILSVNRALRT